jgi:TonB family protein
MAHAQSNFPHAWRTVAALLAVVALVVPAAGAQAQASTPEFRTGFCVPPDTTRGTLDPALSAVVSTPQRAPVALPSPIPAYPDEVRRDGYRGSVVLAFVVDTLGRPVATTADVLESTDAALSRWACGAVKRLRYAPAQHEGRPVFAQAVQPFFYSARVKR